MPVLKIDALDLSDTTNYEAKLNGYQLGQPPNKMEFQDYLQDDGGQIIEGSNRYGIVPHVFAIEVKGATRAAFHTNISALAQKVAKCRRSELTLEFRYDGSTNSNYADVLAITTDVPLDPVWIRAHKDIVMVTFHCKPFWRGAQQTIGPLSYSPSPAVIKPGTILGDVDTDAYIEFRGKGTTTFGNNLILSARSKNQIDETLYNPIKNFQGTAEATSTYGGVFKRTSGVSNAGFTNLTGTSTNIKGLDGESASIQVGVGDAGKIYATADGWSTVTDVAHGLTTQDLKSVKWVTGTGASAVYVACGGGGVILRCIGSPATAGNWAAATSGTTENLNACDFISNSTGMFVGNNDTILLTADFNDAAIGDVSFTSKSTGLGSGYHWYCIDMLNANDVFIGGVDAKVYKTINGGTSWTWTGGNTTPGENVTGISAISTSAVWRVSGGTIYGGSFGVVKYNGSTWTNQLAVSGINYSPPTIKMFSLTVGWVAGPDGIIRKTSDGSTWTTVQASGTTANLNSIVIVDASNVNIAGDGYTLLDTPDGGTNWTKPIAAWALTADYEGTARVYARVRTADATPASVTMKVSSGWAGGSVIDNDAVSLANSAQWQWVDLGRISIPCTPLSPEIAATPILQLAAKGSSGTGANFDIDVACLEYEDEIVLIKSGATASDYITADRENEAVNKGRTNVTFMGGEGIKLRPGTRNNILALETQVWAATTDGIDDFDVVIKYTPKYLSPVA